MLDKGSRVAQTIVVLAICELFEVLCSVINLPEWIFRLLAIRYLFLIYLAWIWVRDGIRMNKVNFALSIVSALTIVYFQYFAIDNEPLFFNTGWTFHRWPCYYYVAYLLCYVLYKLYQWMSKSAIIDKIVKMLAKCSYEIFLVQMAACLLTPFMFNLFNPYISLGLKTTFVFATSIFVGYCFNKMYFELLNYIHFNNHSK